MIDNMQQPIPQQQTTQQATQSNPIQFTNLRYMGKEFKSQGNSKKTGTPWMRYRTSLLTQDGKERHWGMFLPLKGKSMSIEQVQENQVYCVGYVDSPFVNQQGETIQAKNIIGFYPERVDSNSLNPVSTNVPVQQEQPQQQPMLHPVHMQQQPLATQQLQQNIELNQFADKYRLQFSPALFNEYHFIVTYMVMKNNNLTPLITQLKALFKSNVMGL